MEFYLGKREMLEPFDQNQIQPPAINALEKLPQARFSLGDLLSDKRPHTPRRHEHLVGSRFTQFEAVFTRCVNFEIVVGVLDHADPEPAGPEQRNQPDQQTRLAGTAIGGEAENRWTVSLEHYGSLSELLMRRNAALRILQPIRCRVKVAVSPIRYAPLVRVTPVAIFGVPPAVQALVVESVSPGLQCSPKNSASPAAIIIKKLKPDPTPAEPRTVNDNPDSIKDKWNRRYRMRGESSARASAVVSENLHLLPKSGRALDLACGLGGNALLLARLGFEAHAWDISEEAIDRLDQEAMQAGLEIHTFVRDVTAGSFGLDRFDVVVTSHFLDRQLCPRIVACLRPGGLLFYQTFIKDRVSDRGPGNDRFRLADNELLRLFSEMRLLVYREEGSIGDTGRGFRDEAMLVAQKRVVSSTRHATQSGPPAPQPSD